MPVAPRKGTTASAVRKTATSEAIRHPRKGKRSAYLITAIVAVIVLIIVGGLYYQAYVVPFQRVIITVDDTQIRMDYFLERTRLSGGDPVSMTQALTNEILIRKGAQQFGISVTPQDIDAALRQIAKGDAESISDSAYKEWYRQQLTEAKVSDARFREYVENGILRDRLQAYLAERAPTTVPEVHLNLISVATEDDANKVIERLKAGEDFAKVAREVSIDGNSRDNGGDIGWVPQGITVFDDAAFGLDVGKISDPIPYVADPQSGPSSYFVLLVTEKSDARKVDDQYLPALQGKALSDWLNAEIARHKVSWNFDSSMYAWIKYQLAKSQPASSQQNQPSGGQQNQPSGGQQNQPLGGQ